ncbi:iron-containing alcohol dehydrogenase [Breznakiella homolactica]|uniref:Iron-containing alcohol dehydrogenase n=1 Tax=Breznakiella homolactica TaxID=2798577 RepID=A0A7T7XK60_9SPIR|nr:iron-containing alcohol dehydrogenase [Breznakiella homolactica]QQO07795.1 iron-containing alcohol dehydrogenase [Breznakiella homolactica]
MSFQMYVPTRILFGPGQLDQLGKLKLPGKKALIVISNGKSTRANGSLDRTERLLREAGAETAVFDRIEANPLRTTVMEGSAFAREQNCDFIVALGGGSVMDASKAIAAMATNEGDVWDYISGGTGGGKPIGNDPLPLIAITTTAGTGSEVDQWGVVSNNETHEKIGFGGDDRLFPAAAIVDPELMKTVPPEFTAYQGFDALLQAVECYVSSYASLMSDMYAITAIENIGAYLAKAVRNGSDLEAREHVAFANTLSGVVMTVSATTSEHSLEHAMSAFHQNLPHGAGLIMLCVSYFTHFIEKHASDGRYVRMAQALGMKDATDPKDFIFMLEKLKMDCGVADLKMSDYGITKEELPAIAKKARETMGGLFTSDLIPVTDEDSTAILARAYR